jgi:LDH2 family malate/lactate/ureidoglycolate dehydrogenase
MKLKLKDALDFSKWVFENNKVPGKYSEICADVLISGDELGFKTHGLSRLGYYIKRIKDKVIDVNATPEIIHDNKSCVTIDGHNSLGQIVGNFAMNQAITKTQQHGISCVAVKNSSHYGIASYYSRYATTQNLVGMSFTNARPAVAPFGGREPKMGTNPYAIAFPSDMKFPFSIDCATSLYQRGDLEVQARATPDNYVPNCAIVSDNQNLTFERSLGWLKKGIAALTPVGGHKGSGLSIAIELMCSAFQSGACMSQLSGLYEGDTKNPNYDIGHFFICIDPENFTDINTFKKNVGNVMREIKASKTAKDTNEILVPGELEYNTSLKVHKEGIEVSDELLEELNTLGFSKWQKTNTTKNSK